MATQQDLKHIQPIDGKNASSVLSNKVLRAFACRVLSMKLGFTKDQISRLTDDEMNDHMDREYPRLSKAELEAELQRIAERRVTRDPDLLYIVSEAFLLGLFAVIFTSPCLILAGLVVEEFFPAKYSVSFHKTGVFAGGTFAFIAPLLVRITAKLKQKRDSGTTIVAQNQSFGTEGVNIKRKRPQLSKECFTLSEYKYSATPDLKGFKGLTL